MAVLVNNDTNRQLAPDVLAAMEKIAATALSEHGLQPEAEISLTVCDNAAIREINKTWRQVDEPTDVLSFPLWGEEETVPRGRVPLGDIVISLEKALAQAEEYGHSPEREILYLFTHGVLHLLGYDHMEEADRQKMRAAEEKLLHAVGAIR
ncbi:MAG TPA: rRNA maturation RNase YbeY [Firmicutes bacterium]|jgi:probable rRNA maturation factor|nr:rRNA maturation RNase YbeY [Bacillota bacterium]